MLLNKELFAIELTSVNDLNRFLNFEITNFQTIGDLAQKLQGQIASRKFKPVNEVLQLLESLLSPQQISSQASELNSIEQLTEMLRLDFNLLKKENLELKQSNKTLLSSFTELQRKSSQSPPERQQQIQTEMVAQDTLVKMEKLVKLNTELMNLNNNLHEDIK